MTENTRTPIRSRLLRVAAVLAAGALAVPALVAPATAAVQPHPEKPDGPLTAVYVEVNGFDLANVADYTLEGTNAPVFDLAYIFAANINYNAEEDRAYLHLNDRVTETLEDAENQVRPVQAKGTKVLLSILGNHQGVGFANFQDAESADAFAQELADVVEEYDLDGIHFDDEWARYDLGAPINDFSFVYLVTSLREKLGEDKLITLYDIGPTSEHTVYDGVQAGDYLDYAWQPYYSAYSIPDVPGMDRSQYAAAAVDLTQTPAEMAADFAHRTLDDGVGAYLTYNLTDADHSAYLSQITEVLYGLPTTYQADPIPDTTRPAISAEVSDGVVTVTASDAGGLRQVTADLYDLVNSHLLAPIGATPADPPLGTTKTVQTWQLPAGVTPGIYTVRAAATDLAGNTSVTTVRVTIVDRTPPTVTVEVGDGVITVTASDAGLLRRVTANLYDANNRRLLGPIGSTPAAFPLGTAETVQVWNVPAGLAPGTYTVRATATDVSRNTGVTTAPLVISAEQVG